MDQALLRNLPVPACMRKQIICCPRNVVIGILVSRFLDGPRMALGNGDHPSAQVCSVSFAIGRHICRTMTVLAGQDRDPQSQGLQHRRSDSITCRGANVGLASAEQRKKLVVREIAEQEKRFLLACRPTVNVRPGSGKFFVGKTEPKESRSRIGSAKSRHGLSQNREFVLGAKRHVTKEDRLMVLKKVFDGITQPHLREVQVSRRKSRNRNYSRRFDSVKQDPALDGHAVARDLSGQPEQQLICPSWTAVVQPGKEFLLQAATPAQRDWSPRKPPDQGSREGEHVPRF